MNPAVRALLAEGAGRLGDDGYLSASHGFLPVEPPLAALPATHRAWDEAAALLPELMAHRTAQRVLRELPLLPLSGLGEEHLRRAALVLGMLAHAYARDGEAGTQLYVSLGARGKERPPIPDVISQPWEAVCKRLGRPSAALTYGDIILSNWRLRDAALPREVENLDVLVPALGNQEERIFYMTMVETHARSAPLVAAAARLTSPSDASALREVLETFVRTLRDVTFRTLLKIDPNPHSPTHVDPLVWAKTVAPFAAPTRPDEPGLSGAGSPLFPLLDAFFARTRYGSSVGQESEALARWLPRRQREFIQHVRCPEEAAREAGLGDLYREAWEAYAGKRGWLGVHRLKVYGFMELGFKAGRTQTNGGFSGRLEQRAWEDLDDKLEEARAERPRPRGCPVAHVLSSVPISGTAHEVVLRGPALQHEAGDRLGIFPKHRPELVARTLAALRATGAEPVGLTALWHEALDGPVGASLGAPGAETLPLRHFLEHAALRPLSRAVARALYALTRSPGLRAILEERREDQLELWDALEVLAAENYDVRRLWKAPPWQRESLARIVPPARYRIYSLSSLEGDLRLTVGTLSFDSPAETSSEPTRRLGAASHRLTHGVEGPVPVEVVRPSRFRLPDDPAAPIVMFAGGTGVAPFVGFLHARAHAPGKNVLFLGTQSPSAMPYRAELEQMALAGRVQLHVAFSREQISLVQRDGAFHLEPGASAHVDALVDAQAPALWALLQRGAYFYVCGQTPVAHSVTQALRRLLARFSDEPVGAFRRLCAEGRLMFDVFTTSASASAPGLLGDGVYGASELARHNSDEAGYWIALGGNVYDVTEFMHLHPGGLRLLRACAGTDATASYERAEHHLNPEIHSVLDLYKVGQVRRLDFRDAWGMTLTPEAPGVAYLSLQDLYRHWARYLYAVVETENALQNNLSLRHVPLRSGEPPGTPSALRDALVADTHATVATSYVPMLLGARLDFLWRVTTGMCAPDERVARLAELVRAASGPAPTDELETRGPALVADLKQALVEGIQVFERLGAETAEQGGPALVEALLRIPEAARRYFRPSPTPAPLSGPS